MALIKDYFEKTKQIISEFGENTILLMQVGAFFEVYGMINIKENNLLNSKSNSYSNNREIFGSNIEKFASICDLNIVEKKVCCGDNEIVMAGFKDHLLDKYIKKLQDAGTTSVVYVQDEQCAGTTRSLLGVFSPGTYFSNDIQTITNNSVCIWLEIKKSLIKKNYKEQIYIGASQIDILTGQTSLMEYNIVYNNNPTTFDELENYISIYNPSETIIITNLNYKQIEAIINFINLQSKTIHYVYLNRDENEELKDNNIQRAKNCEKQNYCSSILQKFYKINDFNSFFEKFNDYVYATQSFCYLLDFIYIHNPNLISKINQPNIINSNDRLILANHSLKQLNIIEDTNYKGKYSSILNMLNEAQTANGRRLFTSQLLNPSTNINYLNEEYSIIEYLINNRNLNQNIRPFLFFIKDLNKLNRTLTIKKVSPKALYGLYYSLTLIDKIYKVIENDNYFMNYLIKRLKNYYELSNFSLIKEYNNEIIEYFEKVFKIEEIKNIDNIQKVETSFINSGINEILDNKIQILNESQDQLYAISNYFNSLISCFENSNKSSKKTTKSRKTSVSKSKKVNKILLENDEEQNERELEKEIEIEKDKNIEYIKVYETEKNNFSIIGTERRIRILEEILNKQQLNEIKLTYNSSLNNETKEFILYIGKDNLEYVKQSSTNKSIQSNQINKLTKEISLIKVNLIENINNVYNSIIKELEIFIEKINILSDFISYIDVILMKSNLALKYNYTKPIIEMELEIDNNKDNNNNINIYENEELNRRQSLRIKQNQNQNQNIIKEKNIKQEKNKKNNKNINISNKSFVKIKNLRHPLIENLVQNELYIGNDITLGCDEYDGILLYGTNAVGKTSFIRALGISIIMAQSGLYVPASYFSYKPYKCIFTRILGNDNLFKGLSTFAVEMSELNAILNGSNENSLILGDELCSGTESISAISIFVAGIQELSKKDCSYIFATHLHEIVNYDEIVELKRLALKHMSVIYDKEKDMLIYDRKLKDGPGHNLYGLEVCKALNLPQHFLDSALNIRLKYHPEQKSPLEQKASSYNSKSLKGMCEKCGKEKAVETHHLIYQQDANDDGIIEKLEEGLVFHKNHSANLLNICEKCHNEIHKSNKKYKKAKSNKGNILIEINQCL